MLIIECKGTPYQIGHTHGTLATPHIHRSITFYARLFQKNCHQSWPQVLSHASQFADVAKQKWPAYYEEMRGIADGAGVELLDIVALNVRTEINFGLFSDGCTSLAWKVGGGEEGKGKGKMWVGQNWDWQTAQKDNLIITKISQPGLPTIQQITEAGILGKIGFNSAGVSTCLNAIRVHGVDATRMPVHFGLRAALESHSALEAVEKLEGYGMASSAHILIADATTAIGLEFTKSTFARCELDGRGRLVHANHMLLEHPGEVEKIWLKDSLVRVKTMRKNCDELGKGGHEPSWEEVSRLFEDEQGYPTAICREETAESGSGTLFNIVMELGSGEAEAVIRMGRPVTVEETVRLKF